MTAPTLDVSLFNPVYSENLTPNSQAIMPPSRARRYSDAETMKKAYEAWYEASPLATVSNAESLREAFYHHEQVEPTDCIVAGLLADYPSPFYGQVYRDRLLVDYLHKQLGFPLSDAIDLWDDWENYEYALLNKSTDSNN